MAYKIAVGSQKGGTGKTSLTQNLAVELTGAGKHVLCVDMDPQADLTRGFGIDPDAQQVTVYQAMNDPAKARATIQAVRPHLDLMPANLDLAEAEIAFIGKVGWNSKLRKALAGLAGRYDFILIDCPPTLGIFTLNAFTAADGVLIPLQAEFYALKAVSRLLPVLEEVREDNASLQLLGVVLTMYDARTKLCQDVAAAAQEQFGERLFATRIPRNVRIAEAPAYGESVSEYEAGSRGALAYKALAQEVLQRAA